MHAPRAHEMRVALGAGQRKLLHGMNFRVVQTRRHVMATVARSHRFPEGCRRQNVRASAHTQTCVGTGGKNVWQELEQQTSKTSMCVAAGTVSVSLPLLLPPCGPAPSIFLRPFFVANEQPSTTSVCITSKLWLRFDDSNHTQ